MLHESRIGHRGDNLRSALRTSTLALAFEGYLLSSFFVWHLRNAIYLFFVYSAFPPWSDLGSSRVFSLFGPTSSCYACRIRTISRCGQNKPGIPGSSTCVSCAAMKPECPRFFSAFYSSHTGLVCAAGPGLP
ncbi:hypothetical protein BJX64DRAFT_108187 [Aspergillus heterothallicus]